jgi:murein hydrolase activator
MRRTLRISLALAFAAAAAAAQAPPPTRQDLEDAERARSSETAAQHAAAERAAAAAAEATRLTAARIAAATKLRQAEAATTDAASRMDALAARRREAQARLDAHMRTLEPLLPLIERLSLYPAETLLAVPEAPEQTLRGVLVLRGLTRQIVRDAMTLRREQAELDAATRAVAAEAPQLATAEAAQQAEADELDRQIAAAQANQKEAQDAASAAADRAAAEAARAANLRGVLATLDAQRRADEAHARAEKQKLGEAAATAHERQAAAERQPTPVSMASAAQPHGQLTAPVAGTVVRAWGEPTDGGPAMGISYHAAPAARVVAPCSGRVVFSDRFRSYGLLLIVDCGGGYHAVLAGFDRLDAKVGQTVAAGEPIGVMPAWEPGSTGSRPSLYVELRHDGQPVNPAPWLRANG